MVSKSNEEGKNVKVNLLNLLGFIKTNIHLGILIYMLGKLASRNLALSKVKNIFLTSIKKNLYNFLFKSHLEYGLPC